MSEGSSSPAPGDSSNGGEGGIWRGLRAMIFGAEESESLRERIEEVIAEHEGEHDAPIKGDLTPIERKMLRNILHFGERDAGDVGVPRADMIALEEKTPFADVVALFADAGHSRLPVYREKLDTIVGMVHVKDVFAILAKDGPRPDTVADLLRQPLYVPQSMETLDLLALMQSSHTHLAIVLDEYSGTEGLITIEDLIEEIVGEIEDEHDEAPQALFVPLDGGAWEADARAELEDAAELIDKRLGEVEEDVETLGGLAFVLAGEVPQPGTCLDHPSGWRLEIVGADTRRVTRLRLHPPPPVIVDEEE